jgi:hypothetical protein
MAGVALPRYRHHPTVVSRSGKGCCGLVTGLAGRGNRDVVRRFAQRCCPVMARRATRRDSCMTELCPRKRRRRPVAGLAGRGNRDVVRRFAQRCCPVMARRAATHDPRVIERRA